jgi:hypothetical protein
MHLVQLLLPLYDNNKQHFLREEFNRVRDDLAERFGGVTAFSRSPAEGVWREGQGDVSHDEVVIFEVMTERLDYKMAVWIQGDARKPIPARADYYPGDSSRAALRRGDESFHPGSLTRPPAARIKPDPRQRSLQHYRKGLC